MFHVEYRYTMANRWYPLPAADYYLSVVLEDEDLAEGLYEAGYLRQAQAREARCAIGHFYVWHLQTANLAQPRYAIEIDQVDDGAVVWIADLPTLWEFLRQYASIGAMVSPWLPGDGEEVICEGCGAELETDDGDDDNGTF